MRPDVIVLNDPARGIDVGAKAELYKHLRAFAEQGRAVVYMFRNRRVPRFRHAGGCIPRRAPFDAFDGTRLETKRVLEAMFGQTPGDGLVTAYGLTPGRAAVEATDAIATEDGVRVKVTVPAEIRARLHAGNGEAFPPPPAQVPVRSSPLQASCRSASKTIRVVEFDAAGRNVSAGGMSS